MRKTILLSLLAMGVFAIHLKAQNSVGINTRTPNPNAVLELVSPGENQGFLVPRMTTTQRNGMGLTATDIGMIVYDTDLNQFFYWHASGWRAGLGVLSETAASGDLEGTFPNVTIRAGAVDGAELADIITAGTFGDPENGKALSLSVDENGRVTAVAPLDVSVGTDNINDFAVTNGKIADGTINLSKLDGDGNTDMVLAINDAGVIYWEDRSAFIKSTLGDIAGNGLSSDTDETLAVNAGNGLNIVNDSLGVDIAGTTEVTGIEDADMLFIYDASGDLVGKISRQNFIESAEIGNINVTGGTIDGTPIGQSARAAGSFTELNVEDGALVDLQTGAIQSGEIEDGQVFSIDIADGTILSEDLSIDAIESSNILNGTIISEDIAPDGVERVNIVNNAIDSTKIEDGTVTSADIEDGTIQSEDILNGTIVAEDIATDGVERANIVNDAINSDKIENESVTSIDIQDLGVANSDLAADAVTTDKIATGGVENSDLAADAVTTDKIFDETITSEDIGNGEVDSVDIATNAIISEKILNGEVKTEDLANLAVTNEKVQNFDIKPVKIEGQETDILGTADRSFLVSDGLAFDVGGGTYRYISKWVQIRPNQVLRTDAAGNFLGEDRGDFDTNSLNEGFMFRGGPTDATEAFNASALNTILIGNGTNVVSAPISATTRDLTLTLNGTVIETEIIDNAVQGNDIDATTIPLAIAGDEVISFTTSSAFTIDGTVVSIDGTDNTNLTMTANDPTDKVLTIDGSNAGAGSGYVNVIGQDSVRIASPGDITLDAGGNVNISGNFAPDNLDVDGLTQLDETNIVTDDGDFTVSGAERALISSTNAGTDAIQLDATVGDVDINGTDVTVDASAGDVSVTGATNTNVAATAGDVNVDAAAGIVSIDADGTSNFTTTTGAIDINAAGQLDLDGDDVAMDGANGVAINAAANDVDITGNTNVDIVSTTEDITLNAGDAVDIDAADSVSIDAGTYTVVNGVDSVRIASPGDITLDAGGNVNISGNFAPDNLDVDGLTQLDETNIVTDDGDFTVSGAERALISSTNAGTDAIQLDATVGDVDINGTDVTVDASAGDVSVTGATNTNVAATAGDVNVDAAAGIVSIDADGTSNFTTTTGAIDINAAGQLDLDGDDVAMDGANGVAINAAANDVDITGNTNVDIVSTTEDITLNAGDAVDIDAADSVSIDAGTYTVVNGVDSVRIASPGDITLDAGGNVNISGNFAPDNLDVDGLTQLDETNIVTDDGDFTVSGAERALISSTNAGTDAIQLDATVGDVDINGTDVTVDASAGDVSVTGATNTNVAATAGDVNVDAAAGIVSIDADGTSNFTTTTGAIDINAAGQLDLDGDDVAMDGANGVAINAAANDVDITGNTNVDIVSTTEDITLNAGDAVDIDAADSVSIDAGTYTVVNGVDSVRIASPGDITLDAGGNVNISGNFAPDNLDVDGLTQLDETNIVTDDGDFTVSGAERALISSTNAGTDAIQLDATVGDVDINGTDVTVDASAGDVSVTGATNTNVAATAGDVNVDAAAGIVSIDADGTSNFTTTTGDIDINAAGQLDLDGDDVAMDGANGIAINAAANDVDITGNTNVDIVSTTEDITLNAGDAVDIDAADSVSIDAGTYTVVNGVDSVRIASPGDITLDAGGNVNISGNFAPDNLDVDGLTQLDETNIVTDDGDFTVSGAERALISSTNAGTDAIQLDATVGDVDINGTDVTVDASAGDVSVTGATNTNVAATAGDVNVDAAAGIVSIDADGTSNFTTTTGDIDINAAGQLDLDGDDVAMDGANGVAINAAANDVDITGNTNVDIVSTTEDITLNAGDAVDIDAADSVSIDAGTYTVVNGVDSVRIASPGDITLDAGGNVNISGNFAPDNLDVDGLTQLDETNIVTDDGDFTVSGAERALISSTNAGTDAIQLDATVGDVDINGTDVTVDASAGDVSVTGATNTNVAATAGDVNVDAAAGIVSIDADGTSNFTTTTGDIDINAAGQLDLDGDDVAMDGANGIAINAAANDVDITGNTNVDIVSTTEDITLNAGDAVDIDAADSVSIDAGTYTVVNGVDSVRIASPGDITLDAGGNVNISGNFAPDNLDVDGLTQLDETNIVTDDGDFTVSGAERALISSTNAGTDAIQLDATVGDVDINGTDVTVDASAGDVSVTGATNTNVAATAGDVNVDAAAGIVSIDADGTSNFTTTTGDIDINAAGQLDLDGDDVAMDGANGVAINAAANDVDITGNTNVDIVSTTEDITLNAGDAVDIDAADSVSIDAGTYTVVNGVDSVRIASPGDITLDAGGNVNISGNFAPDNLDVDGLTQLDETNIVTDDGDFTVSGAERALISSTNAGTDAIQLDATVGDVDINGTDVTVDASAGDVSVTGATNTNVAATAGDVNVDAAAGIVSIDADGTSNFTTTTGAIDINAAGQLDLDGDDVAMDGANGVAINAAANDVDITGNTNVDIVSTTEDITLNAGDAVDIDAADSVSIDAGTYTVVNGVDSVRIASPGDITLDAGGNVNISGNFAPDNLDVDGLTQLDETNIVTDDGDFTVSGAERALISSTNAGTDAIQLDATVGDVDINGTDVTVDASAGDVSVTGATNTNVAATAGDVNVDAAAGIVSIDADGTSNFTTTTGAIDINAAGQLDLDGDDVAMDGANGVAINAAANDVDITGNTNVDIVSTTEDITLNAGDAVDIDAADSVSIDAGTYTVVNGVDSVRIASPGDITLDAGGNVNISGNFAPDNLDVDGLTQLDETNIVTDDGDFTVSGAERALISSTNAGTDAIQLDAQAGSVDIDGATGVTVDAAINNDITLTTSGTGRVIIPLTDINGGNIDGTTIATSDIDMTGQTLTLDDDEISGDKVEGGTINATTINTATIGTLGGTTLDANSVDITNIDVNSGTIDGVTLTQADIALTIQDNTDNTKQAVFEASGISTSTTRTYTLPDANGTIVLDGDIDLQGAYDGGQTIVTDASGPLDISGTNSVNVASTNNAADAISLSTNGGINETIRLTNTQGTGANAIQLDAQAGSVDIDGATGVTVDAAINNDITLTTSGTGRVIIPLTDINGGNIDGTTIATSDIDMTGQTLTLDDDEISGDKVEGGTINATTINTATIGTLGGTTLDANSVDITNIDVNSGTIDGVTLTQADIALTIQDNTDNTKQAVFEASGISTSTTRTYTLPDANGTIVLDGDIDLQGAYDGGQTIVTDASGPLDISGTNSVNVASTNNAADAISLSTNGGINETIRLTNTQGTGANAIQLDAQAGSVDIDGATGVTVDAAINNDITLTTSGTGRVIIPLTDINGGNIDGTTIATSDIDMTGQTLTLDDDEISGDKVEGGTINATTINTATIGTLGGTTLDANSVDITNIDVNSGTIDGVTLTQADIALTIQDNTDNTKQAVFEASGISTSTTRTYTLPDANGTIVLDGDIDLQGAYDGGQTIVTDASGPLDISGTNSVNVASTNNAADAISLSTNGGINETIRLTNTQGTGANAIQLDAQAGSVDIDGATGVTVDAAINNDITLTTSGTGRVIIPLTDINGGNIDGTTIATSDIDMTGQTLTLDDDEISGDKVEGGTINATTINTATIGTLGGTTLDANSVDITNIDVNSGTIDGVTLTQADIALTIQDNTDNTKQAVFEASGISTSTTRTYTLPDANGTIVLDGDIDLQSAYNGGQAIVTDGSGPLDISGTNSVNVSSTNNAADAISLSTNGGINETIRVTNTQGTGASAIQLDAQAGSVAIDGATGVTVDATAGSLVLDGNSGMTLQTTAGDILLSPFNDVDIDGNLDVSSQATDIEMINNNLAAFQLIVGTTDYLTVVTSTGSEAVQVDQNLDADMGLDVTGANLTVGSTTIDPTSGDMTVGGILSANGAVNLGDNIADQITITGEVQGFTIDGDIVFEEGAFDATLAALGQTTSSTTFNLPDYGGASATLTTRDGSETLSNKTIDADDNTISNIGSAEVTDNSLTTDDLGTGSVDTDEIVDNAVTTDKIAGGTANAAFVTDASGDPIISESVGFEAYLNSSYSPTLEGDLITFDTEIFDDGNDFDATTYTFTAPADGLYHFEVQVELTYDPGVEVLQFTMELNGSAVAIARGIGTSSVTSLSTSKTLRLSATDTITIQYDGDTVTGGDQSRQITGGRSRTFFSGHLIR